jgi:glycosyltransferase involved in cell wall biosynthesis
MQKSPAHPLISVIIPFFNAARTIRLCLDGICSQTYPASQYEVILVDNASTDHSRKIAEQYHKLIITEHRKGPSAARNAGIRAAKGDIFVFIDADCVVPPDFLQKYADSLKFYGKKRKKEIVLGGSIDGINNNFWALCDDFCSWTRNNSSLPRRRESHYLPTANICVGKKALLTVGGFDENLLYGEDVEFCHRLLKNGFEIYFEPEIRIHHVNKETFSCLINHAKSWASGEEKLYEKGLRQAEYYGFFNLLKQNLMYIPYSVLNVLFRALIAKRLEILPCFPFIFLNRLCYCYYKIRHEMRIRRKLIREGTLKI